MPHQGCCFPDFDLLKAGRMQDLPFCTVGHSLARPCRDLGQQFTSRFLSSRLSGRQFTSRFLSSRLSVRQSETKLVSFVLLDMILLNSSYFTFWLYNCRSDSQEQEFSLLYCWTWFCPTVLISLFGFTTVGAAKNDSTETNKYFSYCRLKRWLFWNDSSKSKKPLINCNFYLFLVVWWQ